MNQALTWNECTRVFACGAHPPGLPFSKAPLMTVIGKAPAGHAIKANHDSPPHGLL